MQNFLCPSQVNILKELRNLKWTRAFIRLVIRNPVCFRVTKVGQFPYILNNFISVKIHITCIAPCCYPTVAGATHSTGYLGGIAHLTCPEKRPCQTEVCRIGWIRGVDKKDKFIARNTFFHKNKIIKANFTYEDRYHLDMLGNLSIYDLVLNDAGNYTCIRTNNEDLVVQLDVVGK